MFSQLYHTVYKKKFEALMKRKACHGLARQVELCNIRDT